MRKIKQITHIPKAMEPKNDIKINRASCGRTKGSQCKNIITHATRNTNGQKFLSGFLLSGKATDG